MLLTDILVEENDGASGVETGELGKIVDVRVDDNVEVSLLVVLCGLALWRVTVSCQPVY